jgi:hypothetical protein
MTVVTNDITMTDLSFLLYGLFIDLFLTQIFRKRNCGGSANKRTVRLTETGNNQDKKNTCQIR